MTNEYIRGKLPFFFPAFLLVFKCFLISPMSVQCVYDNGRTLIFFTFHLKGKGSLRRLQQTVLAEVPLMSVCLPTNRCPMTQGTDPSNSLIWIRKANDWCHNGWILKHHNNTKCFNCFSFPKRSRSFQDPRFSSFMWYLGRQWCFVSSKQVFCLWRRMN